MKREIYLRLTRKWKRCSFPIMRISCEKKSWIEGNHNNCHVPIPQSGEEDAMSRPIKTQAGQTAHEHKQQSIMLKTASLNNMHNRMHSPSFYMHNYSMHNSFIKQRKQTYIPALIIFIIIHLHQYNCRDRIAALICG